MSNKCKVKSCKKTSRRLGRCYQHMSLPMKKVLLAKETANSYLYEKTVNGFLMRAYRNMTSRVKGIQKNKAHLYVGKPILSKEDFYNWSRNNPDFLRLYKLWTSANYDRRLTPSVNRVDSKKGYTLNNMEWITNSQNSALSSVTRKLKDKERQQIYKVLGVGK